MEGFVTINNKSIFYQFIHEEYGKPSSPLLIFLHEGLGSIRQWKDFPYRLCREMKYPGILYDRFGYGRSESLIEERQHDYLHREAYDYLPALIRELGIQNPQILVGHSDGGTISLLYASSFPEQLVAVVTIAAHVFVEDCTIKGVQSMREAYPDSRLQSALFKYHGSKTDQMFYAWANLWTNPGFKHWDITEAIKNISCPLLCLQGEKDEYATEEQLHRIENVVKGNCNTFLIPACGHSPHLQKQSEVLAKIISFLSH